MITTQNYAYNKLSVAIDIIICMDLYYCFLELGMKLLCSKNWALCFWAVLQKSPIIVWENAYIIPKIMPLILANNAIC